MTYTIVVRTVKNSWWWICHKGICHKGFADSLRAGSGWWREELSETCRVSIQK